MEHVSIDHDGPVGHLTLERPERRNALSLALMGEVIEALEGLPSSCHVVVIGGAGPAFYARLFDVCTQMMETIHRIPQPVIARVHGIATAAGCQLVAACDLAVAAESATFATPGVKIGLFCSTPMVPISRAVGRKRAMEMLLTGDPIDASTAVDWGLVNRAVPDAELDAEIRRITDRIVRHSPHVIGIGKEAFWSQVELDEHRAYDLTKAVMASNARLPHASEGMGAFLAKREPVWPDTA
ncbi:MAG: enoyl-CoA hydratase-related protein [Acidimicrobiia bacterium]|nr:enoyl-CoA hydratase-related protein [Acidimicrobiia bacterium]